MVQLFSDCIQYSTLVNKPTDTDLIIYFTELHIYRHCIFSSTLIFQLRLGFCANITWLQYDLFTRHLELHLDES